MSSVVSFKLWENAPIPFLTDRGKWGGPDIDSLPYVHAKTGRTCNIKHHTTFLHRPWWARGKKNLKHINLNKLLWCQSRGPGSLCDYGNTHKHKKKQCTLNSTVSRFSDKVIRHRACSLKDTAHAIFAAELDPEFDRMCEEIKEARKKRGKKVWSALRNVFTKAKHNL